MPQQSDRDSLVTLEQINSVLLELMFKKVTFLVRRLNKQKKKSTCGSLRPLESESDVSRYWEEAISTSVDALLRFFSGLQASDISLAPGGSRVAA